MNVGALVSPSPSRVVTVRWAGGDVRRGPLTLGQANMVRCILRDGAADVDIHDVWAVPAGVSVAAVLDALRALTLRHEALRTVFPHPEGTLPEEQLVCSEGEFTVRVVDHDPLPEDPAAVADALAREVRLAPFDLGRDHPLRAVLLTGGGVPVQLGLVAGHAAADGSALSVLREEWLDLLHGRELPPLDGTLTPLELAAEEAAPAGRRKAEASLRYWERVLRTGPQAMFAEPRALVAGGPAPRLTLRSARGGAALARATARLGVPGSTVLLTAWCALVAHRAGQDAYVGAAPTANRYKSALARTVTPLSQDALLHLEVARAAGFDALVKSAWAAALNAYRHSRFDALELWAMIDRVTAERGSRFGRDVVFNDVSGLPGALRPAAGTADPEPGFELTWGPEQVLPTALLCFVHRLEPVLELALWPDPQLFDRDEAAGFLAGLVRLLEAAAEGDVPPAALGEVTGVRPPERGGDWRLLDGCWVSPAAVAAALSAALDGRPVHVDADLTAYLPDAAGELTPELAHAALLRHLPERPGVLAPRRYLIVPDAPAEPGLPLAWQQQPTLLEGSGRPAADPR
ncbi:condensation domain-containing protein [Kitasatospora sp. SolWspMP-SS2h]|uniref:condensation domain-containing protein n=1 Tax=Kitasatospora sp. SolWspMP-SS2h TaxID=1305729 RepID=UPI000DB92A48|nr:condensation domain-containing protein [Kitasatospora sp. SolWspMP-SS2h]